MSKYYVLLMAQLLTSGDSMRFPQLLYLLMRSVFAPSPITLPLPCVTVTSAGAWLLFVCPAESWREHHCDTVTPRRGTTAIFLFIFPAMEKIWAADVSNWHVAPWAGVRPPAIMAALLYRFGNLFCAPPWQSILYHFGNPWIYFYIKFQ